MVFLGKGDFKVLIKRIIRDIYCIRDYVHFLEKVKERVIVLDIILYVFNIYSVVEDKINSYKNKDYVDYRNGI